MYLRIRAPTQDPEKYSTTVCVLCSKEKAGRASLLCFGREGEGRLGEGTKKPKTRGSDLVFVFFVSLPAGTQTTDEIKRGVSLCAYYLFIYIYFIYY